MQPREKINQLHINIANAILSVNNIQILPSGRTVYCFSSPEILKFLDMKNEDILFIKKELLLLRSSLFYTTSSFLSHTTLLCDLLYFDEEDSYKVEFLDSFLKFIQENRNLNDLPDYIANNF